MFWLDRLYLRDDQKEVIYSDFYAGGKIYIEINSSQPNLCNYSAKLSIFVMF